MTEPITYTTPTPVVSSGLASELTPHDKASVLIEALPWLKRFHGALFVVKYGGNAMVDEDLKREQLRKFGSSFRVRLKVLNLGHNQYLQLLDFHFHLS